MKLSLLLLTCALVLPGVVKAQEDKPFVRQQTIDLNGDGKLDKISFKATEGSPRFTLMVNGTSLTTKVEDFFDTLPGFRVLQLEGSSKRKQIVVGIQGANDLQESHFFSYDGKTIRPMGVISGEIKVSGNGAVYNTVWRSFWTCTGKYALASTGKLVFIPQAGYYVGVKATAQKTFPLLATPKANGARVADVAPNSKIELLLFQPKNGIPQDSDGNEGWYLIKSQTGLCGWASFSSFKAKVNDLPFAG